MNPYHFSSLLFVSILEILAFTPVLTSYEFVIPILASDLTIEDLISRQDPLQDKITICHVPDGDVSKAHDITVGESVVSDHLAHGDRIGPCLLTQQPDITVEPPTSCISTEDGLVAYTRMILSGFPVGLIVITGPESSGFPLLIEMQTDTQYVPVEFTTGEKTLTAFADVNRNLIQDDGEVSGTDTVSVTCW